MLAKEFVLNMKTHEAPETDKAQVDFCWELNYIQQNSWYSFVPQQQTSKAWRAGSREGVKMALDLRKG